jgi:hypothetical protein
MKKLMIALILCLGWGSQTFSQNTEFDKLGAWYILASNSTISDQVSIQFQTQLRYFELASEIQQFKIRTGATYKANEGLAFALGYAYFRNDFSYQSDVPPSFDEHRIVEDILLNHSLGKLKINHRLRLENRFIVQNGDTDVRHWYRQMIRFSLPLHEQWTGDLYNEIWLNLDEPVFAQNWLGGGLTYTINELIKTRVGYQRIILDGPDFDRLLFQLTFTPDFRKKSSTP